MIRPLTRRRLKRAARRATFNLLTCAAGGALGYYCAQEATRIGPPPEEPAVQPPSFGIVIPLLPPTEEPPKPGGCAEIEGRRVCIL